MTVELEDLAVFNPTPPTLPIEEQLAESVTWTWTSDQTVLSFDQAIANTGWVVVQFNGEFAPEITMAGTIKTRTEGDRTSWDDTLERSQRLLLWARALMWKYEPQLVIHEMPPVGSGPFVRRSDSSVVAATAIRGAAAVGGFPVAHVAAQKAKKHLTGNSKAKKKEVRQAIDAMVEAGVIFRGPEVPKRLNEHIYDAIALALTHRSTS